MNQRTRYLFQNVGILTISNFSSKIMVFLLVPLYTSVLSTSEYGTYDLVYATIQLLFPLLTVNITEAVMRFSMDPAKPTEAVAGIGLGYLFRSYALSAAAVLVWAMVGMPPELKGLEFAVWLYFASYASNYMIFQFAKGTEHIRDMGIAGVIGTATLLGANILFLLCFRWKLPGFLAANVLCQLLPTFYLGIRLKIWQYLKHIRPQQELNREMLAYCLPLIFSTLGWWVNNASDKYVVAFLCGTAANGLISVAYKIPGILNTLQSIFIQAWQVSAIKEYGGEKTREFYSKTYIYLNLTICAAASGLILLARPLASLLYANVFYDAWQYVPFLLISCVLNSASGFLGPILVAAKDSGSMARSAIYGAAANVVLNIALVLIMGPQGAVIATAASSFIIFAVRRKAVGAQIQVPSPWKIYASWGLLCVQAAASIQRVGHAAECGVMLALVVLNWRELNGAVKMILGAAARLGRKKK